jgi:hypothetical protein
MPVPGVPNNPQGVNSFDHFAPEPAYGEGTKQKALAGGAPMAGGQLAAGAMNSAKRAQRQAVNGKPAPTSTAPKAEPAAMPPPQVSAPASSAELWAAIAASPGAEAYPVLAEMAARARG